MGNGASASFGVFDRYAAFTDLAALNKFSALPLRKSIRVNTLKTTIEAVKAWGKEKGWQMTPVPWCNEAFFIEREIREEALGKDLLHLLGHMYLQEAASMLPVELLDPQPGEAILDMSAAPGSKTTQIAAKMQGRGVIVANDIQEKRLWTLKTALHRSGVTNVIVTKKVGQWFSKNMTARFDRVLCDAPCTAQGTVRKDSDALLYCSDDNIGKMARLQMELLESAIHATKVGGRIVYSTCTLTPEENESVITAVLNKFSVQLEVLSPSQKLDQAIADSKRVQHGDLPLVRLWPQTYDTEGFFCAVLQKTAPTRPVERVEKVHLQERPLLRHRQNEVLNVLAERHGSNFFHEGEALCEREDNIILSTDDALNFWLPTANYSLGLPFGKGLKGRNIRLISDLVMLRGAEATKNVWEVGDQALTDLLAAKDIACPSDLDGDVILLYRGMPLGQGLARDGQMKNNLPRWMVSLRT